MHSPAFDRLRRAASLPLLLITLSLAAVGAAGRGGARADEAPTPVQPVPRPQQFPGGSIHAQVVEANALIHSTQARNNYNVNGAGFTVAVLDTGIRATHVDFAGRVVAQANFTTDNNGDPNNANDGHGHGTNVAGIVAGNADHIGIAPGANIAAVKVLANNGSGNSGITAAGLDWVIANRTKYNITVVNMSLGDGQNYQIEPGDQSAMRAKIQQLTDANVIVVAAAGNSFYQFNSTQGMGVPAIWTNTVSVGAVYDASVGGFSYQSGAQAFSTGPDRITPFSQRLHSSVNGTCYTTVFAPGAPITSAGITDDHASSTDHGTSQATPVTAGVILLLQQLAVRSTGHLPTLAQLKDWMRSSATLINDGDDEDDNVTHTHLSFPRVDALAACAKVPTGGGGGSAPAAPTNLQAQALNSTDIRLTWTAGTDQTGFKVEVKSTGAYSEITNLNLGASATGVNLTGAQPSTTYTFRVWAYNANGDSPRSNEAAVTTPAGTTPTYSISGHVTLNSVGLAGVSVAAGGQTVTTAADGGYTVSNLPAGTYTVAPTKAGYTFNPPTRSITVGPSATADFAANPPVPGAPTNLQAQALSTTNLRLTWVAAGTNQTGFRVEVRTTGAYSEITNLNLGASATGVNLTGAQPKTTYTFRVWAYNGAGDGPRSNEASVTTPAEAVPPPAAPKTLKASPVSGSVVQLSWKDASNNESGFRVEGSFNGSSFSEIGTVTAGTTRVQVTNLSPSTTYYFRIRSYNDGGASAYSNVAKVKTKKR